MSYKYQFIIKDDVVWFCNALSELDAIEIFSEVKKLSPKTIKEMYKIQIQRQ